MVFLPATDSFLPSYQWFSSKLTAVFFSAIDGFKEALDLYRKKMEIRMQDGASVVEISKTKLAYETNFLQYTNQTKSFALQRGGKTRAQG